MNLETIRQKAQTFSTQQWVLIGAGLLLVIILLVMFFSQFIGWIQNTAYDIKHKKDANTVAGAETNANQHLTNANTLENTQKELEKNETNINKRKTENETLSNTAKQNSSSTRNALNAALNQTVPARDGDDGSDDDSLRTDAERNKTAFNARRTAPTATQQPRP